MFWRAPGNRCGTCLAGVEFSVITVAVREQLVAANDNGIELLSAARRGRLRFLFPRRLRRGGYQCRLPCSGRGVRGVHRVYAKARPNAAVWHYEILAVLLTSSSTAVAARVVRRAPTATAAYGSPL